MVENGREIIRAGYAAGICVKEIADQCQSTPGSVRVIAHKMRLRHRYFLDMRVPASQLDDYLHLMRRKQLGRAFTEQVLGLR